jgi:hypothetical protein
MLSAKNAKDETKKYANKRAAGRQLPESEATNFFLCPVQQYCWESSTQVKPLIVAIDLSMQML